MTSMFKLTKAEFKKIFKRPSIFIMAIILVVTIFISLSIFNPVPFEDPTVKYDNVETAEAYYSAFYDELANNSKKSFDVGFANSDEYLLYYKALKSNSDNLTSYYIDVISSMENLMNDTTSSKDYLKEVLIDNLEKFSYAYLNLEGFKLAIELDSNDDELTIKNKYKLLNIAKFTLDDIDLASSPDNSNYYKGDAYTPLNSFLSYAKENTYNSIIDYYVVNNYKSKLENVLNNYINFIHTTINGYSNIFSALKNSYSTNYNYINHRKLLKKDMETIISTLSSYIETITNIQYPIIIIDANKLQEINTLLDDAKIILDNKNDSITAYNEIDIQLSNLIIVNKLSNLTKPSNIRQVHLDLQTINNLERISTKVTENKSFILNNISENANDTTTTNISKYVTEYKLLQHTYQNIIHDIVINSITEAYSSSEYNNFYGYQFDEFNKYQVLERISINDYYIMNNSYANSYTNTFAFGESSGNKPTAFDFMYFAMELCTIVIIVFSMMLVCSLITGETESGTIKLLLVRPYKRSKILSAKILATIFFVLSFILFSSMITFVGGYFVFGVSSTPILAVLNSSTVFEISQIGLMILNILSLIIDVIFFVLLAVMISILFRNYAASITCSIVLIIVNFAFNILFGGSFWYSLLPGMNLHLFKYLGNGFVSTIAGTSGFAGTIQSLLITGIQSSMTIWFSMFILLAYSIVFLAISYSTFQKRDF